MLNFAIIGVGRIGKRHAFNLARHFARGIRLNAVCDIKEEALKWCALYAKKAARYTDYKEMLEKENLDGVIIATEHFFHPEIAAYCISKGVNTLVEKPLAVTVSAAKEVIALSKKYSSVMAGVSYNQRSNRLYKKAKKLLTSGDLGEIVRADFIITDWYRSQAYYNEGGWRASFSGEGGGCLLNQCVHQLDILQWLIGIPESVISVCATKNRNITVENDVCAILKYKNFNCMFSASSHELKGTNRLEIACDKGKIVITPYSMRVWRHKSEKEVNATTTFGYGFAPSLKRRYSYGIMRGIYDIALGQQLRAVKAFGSAVRGEDDMLATLSEGVFAVELINAIYLSSWRNSEVFLPIDSIQYDAELKIKQEWESNLKSKEGR